MTAPTTRSKPHKVAVMEIEPQVLSERVSSTADSIISTNVLDDMANEQTWPTEEELAGAATRDEGMEDVEVPDAKKGTTPKRIKRIPKGMSEYQAAWIVDETDDEDGDEEEGNDHEDDAVAEEEETVPIDEAMELESERKSVVAFRDLDVEEEEKQSDMLSLSVDTYSSMLFRSDSRTGGIVLKKNAMRRSSLMKLTLPVISLRVRGLHATVAYDRFGQVHGIHTRICPRNTPEYLNLKNSNGPSGTCLGQQRPKV